MKLGIFTSWPCSNCKEMYKKLWNLLFSSINLPLFWRSRCRRRRRARKHSRGLGTALPFFALFPTIKLDFGQLRNLFLDCWCAKGFELGHSSHKESHFREYNGLMTFFFSTDQWLIVPEAALSPVIDIIWEIIMWELSPRFIWNRK